MLIQFKILFCLNKMMSSLDNKNLIAFNAITECVSDLYTNFKKQQRPLVLYYHLIQKTKVSHKDAIEKHNEAFRHFCLANKKQILEKSTDLVVSHISYSARVGIDMKAILTSAGSDTLPYIWQHLLCLLAIFDPESGAKTLLETELKNEEKALVKGGGGEEQFLNNLMSNVGALGGGDVASPQAAMAQMMSSGMLTDLMTGLQSGSLDMNKLLSTVKGMMSQVGESCGDDPHAKKMVGMMNTMIDGLVASEEGGEEPEMPDIQELMSEMQHLTKKTGNEKKK